jgi:hypothetical protein
MLKDPRKPQDPSRETLQERCGAEMAFGHDPFSVGKLGAQLFEAADAPPSGIADRAAEELLETDLDRIGHFFPAPGIHPMTRVAIHRSTA